jgi:L-threonylcarbamoyladenylate synthase
VSEVETAVAALRRGDLVVLPTDTVYGLACAASDEAAAAALYCLKGRQAIQPTAVIFASIAELLRLLPELPTLAESAIRALLPGPYTLVVPNPAGRYPWLNVRRPGAIGTRVPDLPAPAAEIVTAVGAVVATSANLPGEADPRRLADVPAGIRAGAAAVVDGGELPGAPSTVIDLTRPEPVVLRAGAADPEDALARIAEAVG